jgi:hypothetical protein
MYLGDYDPTAPIGASDRLVGVAAFTG